MALTQAESVGYGYGGIKEAGSPTRTPESPHEELAPDQSSSSLSKQNSIFSLTLDQIQLKSGRTFGSMNMDEFLANLWNVEENQLVPTQLDQVQWRQQRRRKPTEFSKTSLVLHPYPTLQENGR
ncbi:hypothetical protein V6N13_139325 [Hibiscus sabdariffa]|uniref:Uncharacterized protein n=1 Tax=Hibiscus sabdariffa TaxID=183260 RepID=A0ABR2C8H4_9ROSI